MSRILTNWLLAFIVLVVVDVLWHGVLFGGFYYGALSAIARTADGKLAGLIPVMLLADGLAALAYSALVRGSTNAGQRVALGILAATGTVGFATLQNTALIAGWSPLIALVDIAYAVIVGALLGLALHAVNRGANLKT